MSSLDTEKLARRSTLLWTTSRGNVYGAVTGLITVYHPKEGDVYRRRLWAIRAGGPPTRLPLVGTLRAIAVSLLGFGLYKYINNLYKSDDSMITKSEWRFVGVRDKHYSKGYSEGHQAGVTLVAGFVPAHEAARYRDLITFLEKQREEKDREHRQTALRETLVKQFGESIVVPK